MNLRLLATHWRNYGPTLATELAVIISQVVVFKLAAVNLGRIGFSEYMLSRRIISFIQPVLLVGMGVALPRYIAGCGARQNQAQRYLSAALSPVLAICALVSLCLLIERRTFAYLFFGSAGSEQLVPAIAVMLFGLTLHSILYGYLRGQLKAGLANMLQFANIVLVPLAIFAFRPSAAVTALWQMAFASTLISALGLLLGPARSFRYPRWVDAKELIIYGVQRVPGDFVFMAFLSVPPILVAHLNGLQTAGFVALGISFANMTAAMFYPVGVMLLPRVSNSLRQGRYTELRSEIILIAELSIAVPAVSIVVIEVLANIIVRHYMGTEYESAANVIRVVVLGALPLSVYCTLRNVIDAMYKRAVNTGNLLKAFAVFSIGAGFIVLWSKPYLWMIGLLNVCLVFLAVLTFKEIVVILGRLDDEPQFVAAN